MSRDLSYRVWDEEKKEYSDKSFSLDQYGLLYVQDEDGYWEEASGRYIIEFSTGLEDKNGKEISEGDIVKVTKWVYDEKLGHEEFVHIAKISWWDRYAQFGTDYSDNLSDEIAEDFFEVIGNIHENPELLGGEE